MSLINKVIQRWYLWGVALIGTLGGLQLSLQRFNNVDACPDIINGLPACYVTTFIFIVIFLLSFITLWLRTLLVLSVFGWLFAGFAVLQEIRLGDVCPQTSNGIPLCYIAFGLFSFLLIGIWWQKKHKH